LALQRAELVQVGQRQGYVDLQRWQTTVARLDAFDVPPADQAQFRAELCQAAATQRWLFPDEAAPSDPGRRLEVLVAHARSQASRKSVITEGYLSTLLALGCRWELAHDDLAQALAHTCVAERWPVDWELACEMEGLLGAELADERAQDTRADARIAFERRGRKGWLSQADVLDLYSGARGQGVSEPDARTLLDNFHVEADVRHWAWGGGATRPSAAATNALQLLVGKAAAQARRKRHVSAGFRQALIAEAAATNLDSQVVFEAIADRREREHWSARFDPCWELGCDPSSPWWERWFRHARHSAMGRTLIDLTPVVRPVAPTWLRMATPLMLLRLRDDALGAERPCACGGPARCDCRAPRGGRHARADGRLTAEAGRVPHRRCRRALEDHSRNRARGAAAG
jgi:hypothetical protein